MEFLDRVYAGHFAADAVHLRFEADFSADYDFSKSVRYGEELFPEPDMRRSSACSAVFGGSIVISEPDQISWGA